jgi:hypothetical protein
MNASRPSRLAAAVAACTVLALVVFAPAAAQAAPPPAPGNPTRLCSIDELRDPANWQRCMLAGGSAANNTLACMAAPSPTGPDMGFAGMVAIRPDASLYSGVSGQYTDYGPAGYDLQTYGLGCAGDIAHPNAVTQTALASTILQWSAGWLAIANTGRFYAYQPDRAWGWFDHPLDDAVHSLYHGVWLPCSALFIVIAAVYILARAHRGSQSEAATIAGWAMLVTVLVTFAAQYPSASARIADNTGTAALETMHSAAGLGPQPVPAGKCVLGPEACVDHRTPSDRTADDITTALLYNAWLQCEFGSATSPTAVKYGHILFDAQALTWGDAETIRSHPELRATIYEQKAALFKNTAATIKAEDPQAYEYLQGLHPTDRLFTSVMAAISVALFNSFDLAATLVIAVGFGLFRLVIISLPVTGTIGVAKPLSAYFRRSLSIFWGSLASIVAFGAGSTIYLFLVDLYFSIDTLPAIAKIGLMAATALAAWMLTRPIRGALRSFGVDTTGMRRGPFTRLIVHGVRAASSARQQATTVYTGEVIPRQTGTAVVPARRAESFRSH